MKKLSKLVLAVLGIAMLASTGLSYEIPPYATDEFNTYITNAFSWAGWGKYGPAYRNWNTVQGMPTFMIESVRLAKSYTACTVKFDRWIALPFVCGGGFGSVTPADSARLITATVKIFRDYDNNTPLNFSPGTDVAGVDSFWFSYPGFLKSIVITYAQADTPAFMLVGGFALPTP